MVKALVKVLYLIAIGRRMWALPLSLGAAILLSGCDGLCNMTLHNDLDKPVTATYSYSFQSPPSHDKQEVSLAPHSEKNEMLWFEAAPPSLRVTASGAGVEMDRTILFKELPPEIQRGSSAAQTFHVHIRPSGITVNSPTIWDDYGWLFEAIGIFAIICGAAFLIGQAWIRKRSATGVP